MSHTVKINLTADQEINILGDTINIHDLETIFLDGDGKIIRYHKAEDTNKHGKDFLNEIRAIIGECGKIEDPARAAHTAAFSICVMLDGSGEHIGKQFRVVTEDGEPVDFYHHDL